MKDMSYMFCGAESFNNIRSWDLSGVTRLTTQQSSTKT